MLQKALNHSFSPGEKNEKPIAFAIFRLFNDGRFDCENEPQGVTPAIKRMSRKRKVSACSGRVGLRGAKK